ncbi:MAG: hypothetical protein WAV23_00130 [Minisyncoccia bacterium]
MIKVTQSKKIKKSIILDKKEGETPLQSLEKFRNKNPEYKNVSMTYAGRLDPMASGLLLILAGEEVKKKEKYLALPKEYEFEILFGFATDTYDILGKVLSCVRQDLTQESESKKLKKLIQQNLKFFTGKFIQKYPPYSSKPVNGKPMFAHSRAGTKVIIPEREVSVSKLELLKVKKINKIKLLENIEKRINKVDGPARPHEGSGAGGDFRQKEIIKIWQKELTRNKKSIEKFLVVKFKIKCGSGTYVRGIANSLGDKVGIPALAFSIKRTKIGKWTK